MSKIIAIHSFRGGTGKSNLTANLAVAIAQKGNRVAVVDTDLQSPGLHTLFNQTKSITGKTLNDYLWNRSSIGDIIHDLSSHLGIEGKGKLFLIPSSIDIDEIARIEYEQYNINLLSSGLQWLSHELQLDYLLIDTHPGLSRETLLLTSLSDLLFVVLCPDNQDFQGTAMTVDLARHLRVNKIMLILNKAPIQVDLSVLQQAVEQTYKIPVAGILPLSDEMAYLGSRGLFCLQYSHHPLTKTLKQIADQAMTEVCQVV